MACCQYLIATCIAHERQGMWRETSKLLFSAEMRLAMWVSWSYRGCQRWPRHSITRLVPSLATQQTTSSLVTVYDSLKFACGFFVVLFWGLFGFFCFVLCLCFTLCHHACVEIRGQLARVSSLLPSIVVLRNERKPPPALAAVPFTH